MNVYKNKSFTRFARKSGISDDELCGSVQDADRGLIEANLGGGVIKQRLARDGSGKSGGFRVLVVFKVNTLSIFVHGFAKNEVANIRPDELTAVKKLATAMLAYCEREFAIAIQSGTLIKVECNDKIETVSQRLDGFNSRNS